MPARYMPATKCIQATRRKLTRLTIAFLTIALGSCMDLLGDSSNRLIVEIPNSSQTKKVILFERSGGATVGGSYQISLDDFKSPLDTTKGGNVFSCDDDHGKTRLNSTSISFKWMTNDTLLITYDEKLRIFIKNDRVNGVSIFYATRQNK